MKVENESIDQLFQQQLGNATPEVPSEVMENVLNQWQQMSGMEVSQEVSSAENTSATQTETNFGSLGQSSTSIGTTAATTSSFTTMFSAWAFAAIAAAVGAVWFVTLDGDEPKSSAAVSQADRIKNSPSAVTGLGEKTSAQNQENNESTLSSSGVYDHLGDRRAEHTGGSNYSNTPQSRTPLKSENSESKNSGMDAVRGGNNAGGEAGAKTSTGLGNNPIPVAQEGKKACSIVAEKLEGGWIEISFSGDVTDRGMVDWGDGKMERIKVGPEGSTMRHRYFPWTKRDFVIQWVEVSDSDNKNKVLMAKKTIAMQPEVEEEVIPEIITPNGDGYNDEFYVKIPYPEYFEMLIFDKNNAVVYRSNSVDERWNARLRNNTIVEGEYRVLLTLKYSGESSHRFIRKRLIVQF